MTQAGLRLANSSCSEQSLGTSERLTSFRSDETGCILAERM